MLRSPAVWRASLVRDRAYLRDVLRAGNERARALAAETLARVRELMHTDYGARPAAHELS